uniref:Uncharacterized protein n=1 Tax=Oryza meridionalis TaxID=40149 RepID=A0A0E0D870_9ORYZ
MDVYTLGLFATCHCETYSLDERKTHRVVNVCTTLALESLSVRKSKELRNLILFTPFAQKKIHS